MNEITKDSPEEQVASPVELTPEQSAWIVKKNAKKVKSLYLNSALLLTTLVGVIFEVVIVQQKALYLNGESSDYVPLLEIGIFVFSVVALYRFVDIFVNYRMKKRLGKFPVGNGADEPMSPAKLWVPLLLIGLVDAATLLTFVTLSFQF